MPLRVAHRFSDGGAIVLANGTKSGRRKNRAPTPEGAGTPTFLFGTRMSQIRFNQAFIGLVAAGVLGSFIIPPSITGRAQGKVDILLKPIAGPVRGIAGMFKDRWGDKTLPPGETVQRSDAQLSKENAELKQQVIFLTEQIHNLQLVEEERKRLGKLLDYFKPVGVIGGDPSADRESLSIMPSTGVDTSPGMPVICNDGLVGRFVEGRRVRLITDRDFIITGQFGRWEKGKWIAIPTPKPSLHGIGRGAMRVENLTLEDAKQIKPDDWVIIADTVDYPDILQGRKIGQVDSVRALPGKALFAEIIVKPTVNLRQLSEVLVIRK
jgi:cell shape-determining protein MreC